jgi:hypothetical protein
MDCTKEGENFIEKKEWKRMKNKVKKKILDYTRNPFLDSVWINDLSMLYYSILNDKSI